MSELGAGYSEYLEEMGLIVRFEGDRANSRTFLGRYVVGHGFIRTVQERLVVEMNVDSDIGDSDGDEFEEVDRPEAADVVEDEDEDAGANVNVSEDEHAGVDVDPIVIEVEEDVNGHGRVVPVRRRLRGISALLAESQEHIFDTDADDSMDDDSESVYETALEDMEESEYETAVEEL